MLLQYHTRCRKTVSFHLRTWGVLLVNYRYLLEQVRLIPESLQDIRAMKAVGRDVGGCITLRNFGRHRSTFCGCTAPRRTGGFGPAETGLATVRYRVLPPGQSPRTLH
jgi:hypothetical protein